MILVLLALICFPVLRAVPKIGCGLLLVILASALLLG